MSDRVHYNDLQEIARLCADNERLRKALKPFAESFIKSDLIHSDFPDDTLLDGTPFTLGDFRSAVSAMKENNDG